MSDMQTRKILAAIRKKIAKLTKRVDSLEGKQAPDATLLEILRGYPGGCAALAKVCECSRAAIYQFASGDRQQFPAILCEDIAKAFGRRLVVGRPVTAERLHTAWMRGRLGDG